MKRNIFAIILSVIAMFTSAVYATQAEESPEKSDNSEMTQVETPIQEDVKEALPSEEEDAKTEENADGEEEEAVNKTPQIEIEVFVEECENLIPGNMVFGIYNAQKQFRGAERIWVTEHDKAYMLSFEDFRQSRDEELYICFFSGAKEIEQDGNLYKSEELVPLTKPSADEVFSISAKPVSGAYVKAFANEWELYFKNPAKLIDGVCMIPISEYAEALWMKDNVEVNEENGMVEIYANNHTVRFYLDGNDMYADDEVTYLNVTPLKINGEIYVPFRFLIEGLGGSIKSENVDGVLNITADFVYDGLLKSEEFVKKITSKTNYLVWVSKKDFLVTVFEKKGGVWKEIETFECSIGAPDTPTVTGEYDYFSRETRWSYPTYYVGPIMRFYKGYALHSTLIRYNGSPADARLGKKISHGCVRLAPEAINWMVETVPLYSKVYVTD